MLKTLNGDAGTSLFFNPLRPQPQAAPAQPGKPVTKKRRVLRMPSPAADEGPASTEAPPSAPGGVDGTPPTTAADGTPSSDSAPSTSAAAGPAQPEAASDPPSAAAPNCAESSAGPAADSAGAGSKAGPSSDTAAAPSSSAAPETPSASAAPSAPEEVVVELLPAGSKQSVRSFLKERLKLLKKAD